MAGERGGLLQIEALLFDVFGTVVDWRSGVAREAAPFLARYMSGTNRNLALVIDRSTAERSGIVTSDIDHALYDAFGPNIVSTKFTQSNQYRMILGAGVHDLSSVRQALSGICLPSSAAAIGQVPLSAFVQVTEGDGRPIPPVSTTTNAGPYAFADAWRRRYAPAMEEVRAGRRGYVRLDVLHRENLLAILPDFGIDPADVPTEDIDDLNLAWHRLDPWPDSVAGLTRLKSRFIIAPLSNGNIRLMLDMAKRAGLPWDAILGAELVQTYKPRPEAYIGTADILGLAPAKICMVAAHNGDLAAARACGLRTAFIPRPTEHGPGQTTDLAPSENWDLVADDICVLAEQLGV